MNENEKSKNFISYLKNVFKRLVIIDEQAATDRFLACTWPTIIAQIIRAMMAPENTITLVSIALLFGCRWILLNKKMSFITFQWIMMPVNFIMAYSSMQNGIKLFEWTKMQAYLCSPHPLVPSVALLFFSGGIPGMISCLLNIGLIFDAKATSPQSPEEQQRFIMAFFLWAVQVLVGYVWISHESIAQERLQDALSTALDSNAAKTKFVAWLSHDLRTPLVGLYGFLDELSQDTNPSKTQKDLLDKLKTCADSVNGLITNLLDFSMLETGVFTLKPQIFNLRNSLQFLCSVLYPLASKQDITLNCFFRYSGTTRTLGSVVEENAQNKVPLFVFGDWLRLQQIVTNLVTNSIKYSKAGTSVSLSFSFDSASQKAAAAATTTFLPSTTSSTSTSTSTSTSMSTSTNVRRRRNSTIATSSLSSLTEKTMMSSDREESDTNTTTTTTTTSGMTLRKRKASSSHPSPTLTDREISPNTNSDLNLNTNNNNNNNNDILTFSESTEKQQTQPQSQQSQQPQQQQQEINLQIIVEDEGIGIAEAELNRIFDAFYQVHRSSQKGSGLGLYIVREIVRVMGGTINCTSQVGKGTKFVISDLKFKVATEADMRERRNSGSSLLPPSQAKKVRILLAEDNSTNQLIFKRLFAKASFQYKLAQDGVEAVELWKQNPKEFDLILMDLQMPRMNGIEATKEIRKLEKEMMIRLPIPIVALTATTNPPELDEAVQSGMQEILIKPVQPLVLEETVARMVRARTNKSDEMEETVKQSLNRASTSGLTNTTAQQH